MAEEKKKKLTGKELEQKYINYLEVFVIPEIWWQPYPVYHVSAKGNMFSLKSILYIQNGKSAKKYSRKNQLVKRSTQAKIFDALLNIGYFDPLPVVREFPFVIQNHNRLPGMQGSYFLADYMFPTALGGKGLAVELDSEYHHVDSDALRDKYILDTYGVQTFRLKNFERSDVQKGKFKELCQLLRSEQPSSKPIPFDFSKTIRDYIGVKLHGKPLGTTLDLINDSELDSEDIC